MRYKRTKLTNAAETIPLNVGRPRGSSFDVRVSAIILFLGRLNSISPPPSPLALPPFLYQKAFDSVLLLNSSWNSGISKCSPSLPSSFPGGVLAKSGRWDCPSEVGCYQQGAACLQFRSALATDRDLKASHNASCDPSKHAC